MEAHNRSVPYNNDAEMYVIGSVLLENKIMNSLVGKINPEDFYNPQNSAIYKAMLTLYNQSEKIESMSVLEQLKRDKISNIEEYKSYLIDIIDLVPSTSSVGLYIDVVEEKAVERRILANMQELSSDILTSKYDFNTVLDRAEDTILKVIKKRRTSNFMTMAEAAKKVYEQIEGYVGNKSDLTGLNTGYPFLNKATLGLQNGDLMILAARPAVGKSAFAINLALNVAVTNKAHVAIFSLEMSIEQLMMRIYSYKANIELSKIRSGNLESDELLLLGVAREDLSKINLHFDESSSTNISDIRAKCRQLKQAGQLDFVIIDYLQLVTTSDTRGNRQEEVSKISRQLKTLARDLEVPILALSQLSRSIESREDKRPTLADLRESGSIEQDADMVMFLYRRSEVEELDENEERERKEREKTYREIILSIAKNRQGPLDDIDYHFYGNYSRYSEQREKKPVIRKSRKKYARTTKLNKEE